MYNVGLFRCMKNTGRQNFVHNSHRTQSNPTQSNPWMNPIHGHLWYSGQSCSVAVSSGAVATHEWLQVSTCRLRVMLYYNNIMFVS